MAEMVYPGATHTGRNENEVSMAKTLTTPSLSIQRRAKSATQEKLPRRSAVAAVVSENRERAEVYAKSAAMLKGLVGEASEKMATLDKTVFKDNWPYLLAMLRLLRAYAVRKYRDIPLENLLAIIGAVTYFVSPLDLLPDFVSNAGYLDDAIILRSVLRRVKVDLDRFMEWESGLPVTV
jgi:uncharacterized membrane protein YkvA (DUF1232 family)